MNDYITLKKRDILRIGIKDENGIPKKDENNNELYIEFDLEDITTIDRYSKCLELAEKASKTLQNKFVIIEKKEEVKGKRFMTNKQEEKLEAVKEYYKTMEEAIDLFIGKNGTKKIFGDTRYISMFDDFSEMMKPILPKLEVNTKNIQKKIKSKYKVVDEDTIKDE